MKNKKLIFLGIFLILFFGVVFASSVDELSKLKEDLNQRGYGWLIDYSGDDLYSSVKIYEKDSLEEIAEINNIGSELEEREVLLSKLVGSQDVFDLGVFGDLDVDWVVDPTYPADGTTVYDCGEINESGTYTLNQSITYSGVGTCIQITADNVTLNCDDFNITGDGGGYAINSSNATGNAFTNFTLQNCIISGFSVDIWGVGADVGGETETAYNGGKIIINNSNLSENVYTNGGNSTNQGGRGGNGGEIIIYNSNISIVNSVSGDGGFAGNFGGRINITNSNINTINSYCGNGGSCIGGEVQITNSFITIINSHGGIIPGSGGAGGNVIIINSNINTINSYSMGYETIKGGDVILTNSTIKIINSYGATGLVGAGGDGGNITIIHSEVNITDILINITYGTNLVGDANGTSGLLTLNYTNSFIDTNANYGDNLRLKIINSSSGEIDFGANEISGTGLTNLSQHIIISENLAEVNSTALTMLNVSADITLYGLSTTMSDPKIYRNGITECNSGTSPSCYNSTSLNAGTVVFNVSSWTNYSILDAGGEDSTPPTFTTIPANETINYTQGFGVDFDATDETEFGTFAINWTTLFSINSSGYLRNSSANIGVGVYLINVSINDSSGNANSTIYQLSVNKSIPSGSLTNSTAWTISAGTEVTIGLSESNVGDGDVTYIVYRDGVSKNTGETWTQLQELIIMS